MNIHEFLALPHRFRWGGIGGDDCMTFPAYWVEKVTGVDPASNLRGTYRTREEAHSIMESFGGALPFMQRHLQAIGAKRVQHPQDGDMGLVKVMTGDAFDTQTETEVGAIRFGPLWACIQPGGVRAVKAQHIAAWRLPA